MKVWGHYSHVEKRNLVLFKMSRYTKRSLLHSINSTSPTPTTAIKPHITITFPPRIHFRIWFSPHYTSSIRTPNVKAFITPHNAFPKFQRHINMCICKYKYLFSFTLETYGLFIATQPLQPFLLRFT